MMRFRTDYASGKVNQYYIGLNQLLIYVWENYKQPSGDELWKGLEIGAFMGESTHMFLSSGLFRGGFTVIDPWTGPITDYGGDNFTWGEVKSEFERNMSVFAGKNWQPIKIMRAFSENVYNAIEDESLDFIYIDGDHTYRGVKEDIKNYLPKLKKGGLIAGHDYEETNFPEVTKAVNELLGEPDKVFMDTSWIKEIK